MPDFFTHTLSLFKKQRVLIACFLILTLSAFLRFYKTPELFVFTADEEYAVTLALPIVKDFHVIWIGENAADTGFYMGPFWVYFTSFWLNLSKSDPLVLAYISAGIGTITTLVMFLVARSMFGLNVAWVSSLLNATLPLRVYYDKKFWLLDPVPLVAILLLFSLYKSGKQKLWWILVAFLVGMIPHIHLSLFLLGGVILYQLWRQRKKLSRKIVALSFLALLLPLSPLIMFDYFHNGSNVMTPFRLIREVDKGSRGVDFGEHFEFLYHSLGRIWYLSPNRSNADEVLYACHPFGINKSSLISGQTTTATSALLPLIILSAGFILWFLFRRTTWKEENSRLLVLFLITLLTAFIFYPGKVMEYYLLGMFTIFLFIPGIFLKNSKGLLKYTLLLVLIILSVLGIFTILSATNEYGMVTKINLVKKVTAYIGQDDFELQTVGGCHDFGGWRTIFKAYGKRPERSSTDKSLGYLYPDEISTSPTKYNVLISETRAPVRFNPQKTYVISEGGFQALISKNK